MAASSQIACQLYTLRAFTKTPADIAKTFARVKKIGYQAVQCSGMGPIDAKELKKILDGEGLTCCATHVPMDRLKAETQKVIDDHHLWGCKYTAIGGFFIRDRAYTKADWDAFIPEYGALADRLAKGGVQLGYHNHSHEFARFGGKSAFEMMMAGFPKSVWWEIDTYWIAHGGGDPIAWIKKVAGRIPCVHLKDMDVVATPKVEQRMAEIGEGNLNWAGILPACRDAGVEWYIIEQDECYRDPFESIAISLNNLKAMGVK